MTTVLSFAVNDRAVDLVLIKDKIGEGAAGDLTQAACDHAP